MDSVRRNSGIVNANTREVEMDFEWYKDPFTAFTSIDDNDINAPEFDYDCSLKFM